MDTPIEVRYLIRFEYMLSTLQRDIPTNKVYFDWTCRVQNHIDDKFQVPYLGYRFKTVFLDHFHDHRFHLHHRVFLAYN